MAKRQNFVVGSTNPVTVTKTQAELNNGWNKYQVLKAGDLDGVFNAVSDYSNDSSNEIANAIQTLTGAQPTGASQNELAGALQQMREDIETSSLTFKGYVATSAPSSSTYGLVEGNIWINASAMPTTFPVPASSIRVWNGTSWATTTDTYTVKDFDFFRNINNNEGYYWFGGQWTVMSTDMSTTYFTLNQTSGKWEIKPSVNLPGSPTTTTPTSSSADNRIATKKYVDDAIAPLPKTTYFPDLFDVKWADYELDDMQWLRADTFSWQSGAVYQVAYQHLADEVEEFSTATQNANLGEKEWAALAWNGTKFVALDEDGYVSTSTDGETWTAAAKLDGLGTLLWRDLVWDGTKFVALSVGGYVSTSTDGATWTRTQNANLGDNLWSALAWDGTKFVALGSTGYVSTSTDGANWTVATQNANLGNHGWRALAWDGTKFAALSYNGYVSTSTDGTTWTTATQNADLGNNNWYGLAWDGTKFLALENTGYISTSTDGVNWVSATQNANLGNHNWFGLAWDGTKFLALGHAGYVSAGNSNIQTETVAGVTVTYYQADDGHKICPASEESNVTAIYNATGVAWYYIIDTTNQRFKLPRTKFGFTGIRSGVGNYVEAGLPDHTHQAPYGKNDTNNSHAEGTMNPHPATSEKYSTIYGYGLNSTLASVSNSIYGNSNTVQPKATEMYLYFYVGNFTQTATENTAGLNAELFNNKADLNLANVLGNIDFVVESQLPTAGNNYTWYRKYRSGWVEQGGRQTSTSTGSVTITLPTEMADTNYNIQAVSSDKSLFASAWIASTTQITVETRGHDYSQQPCRCFWQVSGIAAS